MQIIFTNWKKLALLLLLAFKAINSFGQVTILSSPATVTATADEVGESFFKSFSFKISGQAADFGTSEGTYVIRLKAPEGWVFNTSSNLSNFISGVVESFEVAISSDYFEITYQYNPTLTGPNHYLLISGLGIRSTSGAVGPDAYITRVSTESGTEANINGLGIGAQLSSPVLRKTPGVFNQLQVLLPGETNAPGSDTGKSGTADPQTAGTDITVRVNAVDAAFNLVTTAAGEVSMSANVKGEMPPKADLTNGTRTFQIKLTQAGTAVVKAEGLINSQSVTATSSSVTINPAPYAKLLILLPGETADINSATGKTGTPELFKPGDRKAATVTTVDQYWNLVSNVSNTITISVTGATTYTLRNLTVSMPASGIYRFFVTFHVANEMPTITVTDAASPGINASVSVTVTTGDYARLLILLPGETRAPNTSTGKTGTVNGVEAGGQISGQVYAVDNGWNIVTAVTRQINITDLKNALINSPVNLINGQATFSATLREAATHVLTAADPSSSSVTANSSTIIVTAGAYKKLLILLPGEIHAPGSATGKTGTATDRVSGQGFDINVLAVDEYWNKVSSGSNTIRITSTDSDATLPSTSTLTDGSSRKFRITLRLVRNTTTITATDETDRTKTYYTTANINVIDSNVPQNLIVLLPGEKYEVSGFPLPKSGNANTITAGSPTIVTIYLLNQKAEILTSANNQISLSDNFETNAIINPSIATAVAGVATFTVTFKKPGSHTLTGKDLTGASRISGTSDPFTVIVGNYAKILALLPGQTHDPGSETGVSGAITKPFRGQTMTIKLIAVDNSFNTVTSVANSVTRTSISSGLEGLPETAAFTNGELSFPAVVITTQGAKSVNYQDQTQTSISVTINIPDPDAATVATDYFRSAKPGNWNQPSNWESSADEVTWMQATLSPGATARKTTVRHNIKITDAITVNLVTVESGGIVDVKQPLTIASDGTFTVNDNGILKNAANIVTTRALEIASGGKYQHAFTTEAGVIPTAEWKPGSVCEVIGYTSFAGSIEGAGQLFSNFNWNAASQEANVNINTDFQATNLTISSTGKGKLIFNTTTTVEGDFRLMNGKVDFTNTELFFDGLGAQTISNNGTDPLRFKKVKFSGSRPKTLSQGKFYLNPDGVLHLEGKNALLNADGKLTLLSDQNSTAAIAPLTGHPLQRPQIKGNVTVQRYISGGAVKQYRTWRTISSPTHNGGFYSLADVIDNVIVTGKGGSSNDFDQTSTNNPSAFIYTSQNGFEAIESRNQKIPAGKGIFLFYRGNRDKFDQKTNYPYTDPEPTIIDFTGDLNQGNISVTLTTNENPAAPATASFNLLGNPYASAISWQKFHDDNQNVSSFVNPYARIWNFSTKSYTTVNAQSGDFIISSGQSFFVQAKAPGETLTFKENHKVDSQPSSLFMFKQENNINDLPLKQASGGDNQQKLKSSGNQNYFAAMPLVKVQLKKPSSYNMDETCIAFDPSGNNKYLISEDACYFPAEEIKLASLSSDNVNLAYNIMEEIGEGKTVKLDVNATWSADYSLTFNLRNIPPGVKIWLIDKYLNTQTPVSNEQTVSFTINKSVPVSFGPERFSIVFNQEPTLEFVITDFKGKKVNKGVMLSWVAKAGSNGDYFQIQRAGSDNIYSPLTATVQVKNELSNYVLLDSKPLTGNNYYQLSMVDKDGKKTTYSKVASIYYDGISKTVFTVYPNPAGEKTTVKYQGVLGDKNMIRVANIIGQLIYDKSVNESELQNGIEINLSAWAPGVYLVELIDKTSNKRVDIQKLIKK